MCNNHLFAHCYKVSSIPNIDYLSLVTSSLTAIAQECKELYRINPGSNISQNSNWTATKTPISKSIQIRRTRHTGHCCRRKEGLISDVLLWTPSNGRVSMERQSRTYLQQIFTDTGCNLQDLPEAMSEWDEWQERERERERETDRQTERQRERQRERELGKPGLVSCDDDDDDGFK